jgi:hypothetical protein
MKTTLNKTQQLDALQHVGRALIHKWSTNGYGSSKIIDSRGNVIGAAKGCGYDRYGAALGDAISKLFPVELHTLAKRHCKGKRRNYKQPANNRLYGLFYDAVKDRAWVDGGCGSRQMENILNALGFGLDRVGDTGNKGRTGSGFYQLRPVSKRERELLAARNS